MVVFNSFGRLLQILEHVSEQGLSEPFRTYKALDQAACSLADDLQRTKNALVSAGREQHYTAARLNGDCEALHRAMYTELQQLVLGPQVCPTGTDQELLCPNAQVGFFPCIFLSTSWSTIEYLSAAIPNVSQLISELIVTMGERSF